MVDIKSNLDRLEDSASNFYKRGQNDELSSSDTSGDRQRNALQTASDLRGAIMDISNLRDAIVERDKLKADLEAAQDNVARANRFKIMAMELFSDPIKLMVQEEIARVGINALNFDISDYEDEIKEIAAGGFDIGDYEDDIRDAVDFNLSDHASDIEDICRDVLRATTVTLDV